MNNEICSIISKSEYEDTFSIIPFTDIQNISIYDTENPSFLGQVIPSTENGRMIYNLLFHSSIVDELSSADCDKINHAIAVIKHELFHIKEMIITNRKFSFFPIYKNQADSTRSLLIKLGYMQWSEYYAHFHSYKYHQSQTAIHKEIEQSEVSLTVLRDNTIKENSATMYEFLYNNIHDFIAKAIILSAHYNNKHDKKCLAHLIRYHNSKLYKPFYDYIYMLIPYMESLYLSYPNWVSDSSFLDIGKQLFSIINYFNITYSTDDLSDNFIFKLKE